MTPIVTYLLLYFLGGITLLPAVLLYLWYFYIAKRKKQQLALYFPSEPYTTPINEYKSKQGWVRLVEYSPIPPPPMVKKSSSFTKTMAAMTHGTSKSGTHSNPADRPSHKNPASSFSSSSSTLFYAILRHGTLFCFDNEQEKTCHLILPMHNYTISLFPKEGKREAELFGRLMSICLTPNLNPTTSSTYYLSCRRPIDKEDWYFAMKAASQQIQLVDQSLMYDTFAMTQLRGILSSTPSQVEAQCWNAIMGRMFLGIYKTDHWHQLWHTKMKNKLARVNTDGMIRLSPFQLQHISMGDTIPCLTNTTLQEFGADGHCVIHGDLTYDGTVLVVIRTDFHWPTLINKKKKANAAASLPLMLSIKLRHCSGKVVFKVKPPPSGRIWAGFQDMPMMEWEVTPVVMETHIKWSMVINMIQAKLKELVLDTLVVPNMEDFPFFDSDGLGGIFGKMDNTTAAASTQEPTATTATAPMTTIPTPKVEPATIDGTITDDTTQDNGDSAIDVDMTFDDDDDDDVQPDNKEPPRVSRLVQGYMNRIKNPHRFPSPLHSRPPSTTKV